MDVLTIQWTKLLILEEQVLNLLTLDNQREKKRK